MSLPELVQIIGVSSSRGDIKVFLIQKNRLTKQLETYLDEKQGLPWRDVLTNHTECKVGDGCYCREQIDEETKKELDICDYFHKNALPIAAKTLIPGIVIKYYSFGI